jgi:uncharacterized membrane protein YtjA (UPF0391 family)
MSKAFMGFVGVALLAGLIGYLGGNSTAAGLARVAFMVSALFAFIAFLLGREDRA